MPTGNVVVIADGEAGELLEEAEELARSRRVGVSLVGIAPTVRLGSCWPAFCLPVCLEELEEANVAWARRTCLNLIREVAPDVPVEYRVLPGRPDRIVGALIAGGQFGNMVLPRVLAERWLVRRAVRRGREAKIALHVV